MFSETVLKFYGQEKKKLHLLLIIVVIISLVKYLSTGDLTMASFGLSCFIFSHQKKQTSWFLSLSKYQACAKLKQRLYISKELDKYSQVDRSLWPASPQEMKDGSQEGELFSAGLNVGLLPKAAVPTLICMCLKKLVCI